MGANAGRSGADGRRRTRARLDDADVGLPVERPERSAKIARLLVADRGSQTVPAQPTPLLGREAEVAGLERALVDPQVRLVTLTGPGGIGKSRLAVEAAAATSDTFVDGVVFVDLVPVREASLVMEVIGAVLRARETGSTSGIASVVDAVRDRRMLLVLDNFEQVLAAAPDVAELVAACPYVTVLVTSRAPLRVRWEHEVPLGGLATPEPEVVAGELSTLASTPAVALFVQRARAVRSDFVLNADNAGDVASICARVQGVPLAIELAAARIRVLSPRGLLARLCESTASPTLDLLNGGPGDLPSRQRSLRDTIAWSYDLLSSLEQVMFRQLTVFAGGWTLEAAEAVCGTVAPSDANGGERRGLTSSVVLDLMLALVEKNLLVGLNGPDGEPRFTMLEAMSEFGREKLSAEEEVAVRDSHARFQLAFVRMVARQLSGPKQPLFVQQLEQEQHNTRVALEWSLTRGDPNVALRMCAALIMFWYVRGHYREGREWCARALAACHDGSLRVRAGVLHGAASLADIQHDGLEARSLIEQSVAAWRLAGGEQGLASSLSLLGMLARHDGDRALARKSCTEALAIYEHAPDPWGERLALGVLGWLAEDEGDHVMAHRLLEASLEKARQGSPMDVALQLNNLGIVALRQGNAEESQERHLAALALTRQVEAHEPMAGALEGLAAVAAARHDHFRAAWLLGAASALRATISSPRVAQFEEEHRRLLPQLRSVLGNDVFETCAGEGAATALDDVIVVALATNVGLDRQRQDPSVTETGRSTPPSPAPVDLTSRQLDYLRLLAQGSTNKAIADALVVSQTAVEQMLVRLYVKIGVRNRAEAVRYCYRHGLVSPSS